MNAARVLGDEESREGEEGGGGRSREESMVNIALLDWRTWGWASLPSLRLRCSVWKRTEAAVASPGWRTRSSFFVGWWKVRAADFRPPVWPRGCAFLFFPRSWMAHRLTQIPALFTCLSCCRWGHRGRVLIGACTWCGGVVILICQAWSGHQRAGDEAGKINK